MVDFEGIGRRIFEQRKWLRRISQETMALDLGMYQADISNLEKAKSGSGITDLAKLDMIAEYFDMPLETLLFGRRQGRMEKYYGTKMQLKEYKKAISGKHIRILGSIMGIGKEAGEEALKNVTAFECGPYMVYVFREYSYLFCNHSEKTDEPLDSNTKVHICVVCQDEAIGCLSANITTIMQHVYQPAFEKLKLFILPDTFDISDTIQILNPYWLMHQFAVSEEEKEHMSEKMLARMGELRRTGDNRVIYYVESAYVREDCRQNGILRMMIDVLKKMSEGAMIWINLEPTSGEELDSKKDFHPVYKASELGQISMNASIAEKLGFTVDSKSVNRQAERIDEDGATILETIPVRRVAYYLPKKLHNMIAGDGDILAVARARRKVLEDKEDIPEIVDVYQGAWKEFGFIISIKFNSSAGTVYTFARGMDWNSRWLGVSRENPAVTGAFVETTERYDRLKDAEGSDFYLGLRVAERLLGSVFFGTVRPEDVHMEELRLTDVL